MTHAYDVINIRFKERPQKQFSVEILRHHQDNHFLKVGLAFACNYWGAHFFCYSRKLSDGQEIVHMVKSADRGNLNTQKWKIIYFCSRYSKLNYGGHVICYFKGNRVLTPNIGVLVTQFYHGTNQVRKWNFRNIFWMTSSWPEMTKNCFECYISVTYIVLAIV